MKKLYVYKGYKQKDLIDIKLEPLIKGDLEDKMNPFKLDDNYKRNLMAAIMTCSGEFYITYEEFVLIEELGEEMLRLSLVELIFIENRIYPGYYPLPNSDERILNKIDAAYNYLSSINEEEELDYEVAVLLRFYGDIKIVDNTYYISYKNSENIYQKTKILEKKDEELSRSIELLPVGSSNSSEYIFEINAEIDSYLRLVQLCFLNKSDLIGIKINDQLHFDKYYLKHTNALLNQFQDIRFYIVKDRVEPKNYKIEFDHYLKDIWGYDSFKRIQIYNNPDENKNVIEISQGQIIEDIVKQSEKAIKYEAFKDVFITAPTGAGKSIIFQIAALYLAREYGKLTIIISPLIALMKDQVKNLKKNDIHNVAYINSELNFIEKEDILTGIKNGDIDLLYLAPESLLSYSIDNFIGKREIGLFIIDEAHIVTTWGKGFRPDYWYLGKYLSRIRSSEQNFPIVTFTATAVYGGNDDMYDETIESLNMKSTIKYLGNIRRNDITFDIKIDSKNMGKEEYEQTKLAKLIKRFKEYNSKNYKTIAYFPFATTAYNISDDQALGDLKNEITLYTGQLNKNLKSISEEEFSLGKKKIMFATKAFGMGIDIDDIKIVYHYAPTGNLNDYVQEIGRAARSKDIDGIACIDFMNKDFNFVNMLFGMSSIKQYQAKAVLKKIFNVYLRREKQNFLVTPNDFSYIFTSDSKRGSDELERKLKTVLLMLEKDLEQTFRFPVMISRPKSMFSKAYIVINKDKEVEILNSKYGKYFNKIQNGRNNEVEGGCRVSDCGDVFMFDLRGLWEDCFPDLSFANFKRMLFERSEELNFEYKDALHLRFRISLQTKNEVKIKDLKELLIEEIDKINKILDMYKDQGKMFSIQEFTSEIFKIYGNREKAVAIASAYIDLISPPSGNGIFTNKAVEFNKSFNKFRIVNRTYNNAKRELIFKSDLIRKMTCDDTKINLYHPKTNKKDFDLFRVLYLLEIFGLCDYEIIGGESPEIFIRLNDPLKIKRLTSESYDYKNVILQAVKRRHENSTKILRKFFTELTTDEERWEFIENYFLGQEVISDTE